MSGKPVKGWKGAGMEGWIARWYARTRGKDMEQFRQAARAVAQALGDGASVLEVAPGPGYFAIELAKLGTYRITGLDVSRTLVAIARENAHKAGVAVDFQLGNASAMPFGNESFDFIYCSAAFKNFSEPVEALDEMHRVLKAGGEAMIADLRKDAPLEEIDRYVKESGRGGLDAWLSKITFRHLLLKRAYTKSDFTRMAAASRFGGCTVDPVAIGFEVRFSKPQVANAGVASSVNMGAWLNNLCDV